MSDSNANLEVVRSVYQAFAAGDITSVLASLAPDVRWTEAEAGPYGGVWIGPDAVLENLFARLGVEWDSFTAVPTRFVTDESVIVALGEYGGTYKATGKSFCAPFAHVWDLAGGKVTSFQQYTDTVLHLRPLEP